jgi:general nucleoside transport system permease protein
MSPLAVRRIVLGIATPVIALVMAFAVVWIILEISGFDGWGVFHNMFTTGTEDRYVARAINRAVPYFFAGCAVAVGFRMALFNIGVEGQYRIAGLFAAWLGAQVNLPAVFEISLIVLTSLVVGAAAAAVPAVLKVTRNVNEVVSTIMLNFIYGGVGTWLLITYLRDKHAHTVSTQTKALPHSSYMPAADKALNAIGFQVPKTDPITGLLFVAIVLGILLHLLIKRTRFGFELRATGLNPVAAAANGVNAKAMVIKGMVLSGALAGFIGLPELLSNTHMFVGETFPQQLGFTGIAVALLGRNSPLGIGLGALLFGFLDVTTGSLQLSFNPKLKIPNEMALVMQGSILLAVVITYEVVRRLELRWEGRTVARAAERLTGEEAGEPAAAASAGGEK